MAKKTDLTVEFAFERSTKGAHRFQETGVKPGTEAVIGTLYVRKASLPEAPQTLTITITPGA